jgi:hypothetical protein
MTTGVVLRALGRGVLQVGTLCGTVHSVVPGGATLSARVLVPVRLCAGSHGHEEGLEEKEAGEYGPAGAALRAREHPER